MNYCRDYVPREIYYIKILIAPKKTTFGYGNSIWCNVVAMTSSPGRVTE